MKRFWTALGFLTVIPVPEHGMLGVGELGTTAIWFSLIGAILGGLVALVHISLLRLFPPLVSACLSVAAWICLTGGLHLDGLADSYDGLLSSTSSERRLEIMKDPRLGTFGVVGLIFTILLKIVAMASLSVSLTITVIPLAASLARWFLLWVACQPMARAEGLGVTFQKGIKTIPMIVSAMIPLGLTVLAGGRGVLAMILGSLVTFAIIHLARRRLGGLTGDILGLTVETVELVVLLVFVAQF